MIVFFTGAGMSKDSGLSTFRDPDGQWAKFRPEELATPEAFARNPRFVWEWYEGRKKDALKANPHEGYHVIASLEKVEKVVVITQNVDGLHRRSGSSHVLELHGNLFRVLCTACDYETYKEKEFPQVPPPCPKCENDLRPGVVWFGESLPQAIWKESENCMREAHTVVIVGTSGVVEPAASLARFAKHEGAELYEINPEKSALSSYVKKHYQQGAKDGLLSWFREWKK